MPVTDTSNVIAREACDHSAWRPEILDASVTKDRVRLQHLRHNATCRILIYDTICAQLRDFVKLEDPSRKLGDDAVDAEVARILGGLESGDYGRWIHYPWSGRLVHVLPPEQFRLVRQDRNHHKITTEEQARLGRVAAGVIGLSVGNAVARTLVLEGAVGHLRLADYDTLDLSNLNRLQAGIHEIATNKAVIAARQIYETDPYAEIEIFAEGLTEANIDRFLSGPPKLDILIDECDGLDMKLLMRERARERRIPVLMETSDRGMLDVERFDIEPGRPLLHGRIGDLRAADLVGLTTEQKVPHILRILAPDEVSARMAASMVEIGRSLTTWPQLASEVQLGGATVVTAVRHLALGLPLPSGRRYIELADLVAMPEEQALSATWERGEQAPYTPPSAPNVTSLGIPSMVRWLAEHAVMAPSAGNCQPWRFVTRSTERLIIVHDESRSRGVRDWQGLASCFAIGAAIENASIAAAALGFGLSVETRPPSHGSPLTVELTPTPDGTVHRDAALAQLELVRARGTNRKHGDGSALGDEALMKLMRTAETAGAHLQLVSDAELRSETGRILGDFDRVQFTNPVVQREFMTEIRWTTEEVERTRDGIDIATLELDQTKAAALRLLMRPDVAKILRTYRYGRVIGELARDAMTACSAIGMLRIEPNTRLGFLEAGRAMQKVWLEAVRLGLGIQPWTAILFLARSIDSIGRDVFDERERTEICALSEQLDGIFTDRCDWARAMLFRVSNAEAPTARSMRRSLAECFSEAVS